MLHRFQFTQFSLFELTNSIWERYKIGTPWENRGSEWPAQGHKVSSWSGSWPWGSAESPVGQSKLQLPHSTPCLNTSKHENSLWGYTLSALKDMFSDLPWQQGDSMTAYWLSPENKMHRIVPLKSNPQKCIKNDYYLLKSSTAICLLY